MKIQTIINRGFNVCGWMVNTFRGERRIVVKFNKKTARGDRFYIAHAPFMPGKFSDIEFTEPILFERNKGLSHGV